MLLNMPFYPTLRLVLALIAMAIRLWAFLNWNKNSLLRNDEQLNLQSTRGKYVNLRGEFFVP